jgi:hypothetical protein
MFRAPWLNVCCTARVLWVVKEATGWSISSMPMQDRKIASFIVVKMAWKSRKSLSSWHETQKQKDGRET